MGKFVTSGAVLQCSQGLSPSTLTILDPTRPKAGNMPMGNVMDFVPMTNIAPFGMCRSMANPQVSAATSAAMGVLTPMPCVPVITAPWAPGGLSKVANFPALLDNCKCMCAWAGQISVSNPGNTSAASGK